MAAAAGARTTGVTATIASPTNASDSTTLEAVVEEGIFQGTFSVDDGPSKFGRAFVDIEDGPDSASERRLSRHEP